MYFKALFQPCLHVRMYTSTLAVQSIAAPYHNLSLYSAFLFMITCQISKLQTQKNPNIWNISSFDRRDSLNINIGNTCSTVLLPLGTCSDRVLIAVVIHSRGHQITL